MALDGMILDLDGTLVDTNALHVEAWRQALDRHGYKIGADRIALEVGKGGDQLVPDLLGKDADARDGEALRAEHPKQFAELVKQFGVKTFPGAPELLETLRRRGIRTALATSSGESHLEAIETAARFPVRKLVEELVTSDDIQHSKPAPDLVVAAVNKLKLSPAQCAMIGDTQYDAQSARSAGVVCLGVTCGGNDTPVMRSAGARAVFLHVGQILEHLDDALLIASPGPAHLTNDLLESLMREALAAAALAIERGEAPIGCVLARGDGTIIARACNEMNRTQNKTAHAEIVAFAQAAGKIPLEARDLILASTLEPCVMCTGAAMESAVDTIVYALRAPADCGSTRVQCPQSPESQMPRIVGGILEGESRMLFEKWLSRNRGTRQARFVEQLLALTA